MAYDDNNNADDEDDDNNNNDTVWDNTSKDVLSAMGSIFLINEAAPNACQKLETSKQIVL